MEMESKVYGSSQSRIIPSCCRLHNWLALTVCNMSGQEFGDQRQPDDDDQCNQGGNNKENEQAEKCAEHRRKAENAPRTRAADDSLTQRRFKRADMH